MRARTTAHELRVVDVARRRARVAGAGTSPQWLPDGRLLRRTPGDRLLLGARRVVDDISAANGWDASPDGRALAIAAGQGTTVVDVKTRAEEQLPGGGTNEVRWSPRGGRIAALAGGTLLLLDTSGLGSARILARFPGRQLTGLAWAPSGRRLAVTSTVAERGD